MSTFRPPRSTAELLANLPNGTAVAQAMRALGLWTGDSHSKPGSRKPFRRDLATMHGPELADEQAYWVSELGRISELLGLLRGQKVQANLSLKVALAKARCAIREQHAAIVVPEGQKPPAKLTAAEINDRAEENPDVMDERQALTTVEVFMASAEAANEATLMYLQTLRREITRRGDEMRARM